MEQYLVEDGFWVGRFDECFAAESHAERRGGATSPSRLLSDSLAYQRRPLLLAVVGRKTRGPISTPNNI